MAARASLLPRSRIPGGFLWKLSRTGVSRGKFARRKGEILISPLLAAKALGWSPSPEGFIFCPICLPCSPLYFAVSSPCPPTPFSVYLPHPKASFYHFNRKNKFFPWLLKIPFISAGMDELRTQAKYRFSKANRPLDFFSSTFFNRQPQKSFGGVFFSCQASIFPIALGREAVKFQPCLIG